jgi:hypothetical protein
MPGKTDSSRNFHILISSSDDPGLDKQCYQRGQRQTAEKHRPIPNIEAE